MPYVHNAETGKTKTVKNLGWLLRHRAKAEISSVDFWPEDEHAVLLVCFSDGLKFVSDFASYDVGIDFIDRFLVKYCDINKISIMDA